VLLTYEKPAAFEVLPGIVFGGNRPLGFISVAACFINITMYWHDAQHVCGKLNLGQSEPPRLNVAFIKSYK